MREIRIATPAPAGSRSGNRTTALRWAALLRAEGWHVRMLTPDAPLAPAPLIALHAHKSAALVRAHAARFPASARVLALAGTDLSAGLGAQALAALRCATRILALEPLALDALPPELRERARVLPQSARARPIAPAREPGAAPRALCLAHLRAIKDPLTLLAAARALPASSRWRIELAGAALDLELAQRVRAELAILPRALWLGELSRRAARERLAGSQVLISCSLAEGASSAIAEALVQRIPVLATRVAGTLGQLGAAHPGCFEAGDAAALARLLLRLEREPAFEAELLRAGDARAALLTPELEAAGWRALLAELGLHPR